LLVGSRRILTATGSDFLLEFCVQEELNVEPDILKKHCIQIKNFSEYLTVHPDNRVDLAIVDVSSFVSKEDIKRINPLFNITEEVIFDKWDAPTFLCEHVYFTEDCIMPVIRKKRVLGYSAAHYDGQMHFVCSQTSWLEASEKEDRIASRYMAYPVLTGSPLFAEVSGKLRFAGIVTGCSAPEGLPAPIASKLHDSAAFIGPESVRLLIAIARREAQD
jgi:hypothetical protein